MTCHDAEHKPYFEWGSAYFSEGRMFPQGAQLHDITTQSHLIISYRYRFPWLWIQTSHSNYESNHPKLSTIRMDRNDKMTHGSILEAQANKPPSKSEVRELLLLLLSRLTLKHAKWNRLRNWCQWWQWQWRWPQGLARKKYHLLQGGYKTNQQSTHELFPQVPTALPNSSLYSATEPDIYMTYKNGTKHNKRTRNLTAPSDPYHNTDQFTFIGNSVSYFMMITAVFMKKYDMKNSEIQVSYA